jgi:hypothetical protein
VAKVAGRGAKLLSVSQTNRLIRLGWDSKWPASAWLNAAAWMRDHCALKEARQTPSEDEAVPSEVLKVDPSIRQRTVWALKAISNHMQDSSVSHEGAFGRAMILSNVGSLSDKALFSPQPPEISLGHNGTG